MTKPSMNFDIVFTADRTSNQVMCWPRTTAASVWVDENVGIESWQWIGSRFAVDARYVDQLAAGAEGAGLNVVVVR